MCGRFFVDEVKGIPKFFDVSAKEMESNFNVSPSQNCAIIKDEGLTSMQWGLVPSWVKDSKIKPINAKAETIREKPFFRNAFKQRRCIVPASGFYEWQGTKGDKTPFCIYPTYDPYFGFAGIWECKDEVETFAIITTAANDTMQNVHTRMPVILSPENFNEWLATGHYDLLRACANDVIAYHEVSKAVNKPANNSRELIKQIN